MPVIDLVEIRRKAREELERDVPPWDPLTEDLEVFADRLAEFLRTEIRRSGREPTPEEEEALSGIGRFSRDRPA